MSFALQYRKQLQAREREERAFRKANAGFVALPVDDAADTRRNPRRVLCALAIAGAFLAVFNSDGLVRYSYGLADSQAGRKIVGWTEQWHSLMQVGQAPRVMEKIRGSVMIVRQSSWQGLAGIFGGGMRENDPAEPQVPRVVPAKSAPPVPEPREPEKPEIAIPSGPVMRAAADALPGEGR